MSAVLKAGGQACSASVRASEENAICSKGQCCSNIKAESVHPQMNSDPFRQSSAVQLCSAELRKVVKSKLLGADATCDFLPVAFGDNHS